MEYQAFEMLNRMKNKYEEIIKSITDAYGITDAEADILLYLSRNEGNTASDIVLYTGYSKSNVSTAVRKLELKNYLTCKTDLDNRRVVHLELTELAKPIVKYGNHLKQKLEHDFKEKLGDEGYAYLAKLMELMNEGGKGL